MRFPRARLLILGSIGLVVVILVIQALQPSGTTRRVSGVGRSMSFMAGEPEIAYMIDDGGTRYYGCFLAHPVTGGTLTDGVAYPWQQEIDQVRPCVTEKSRAQSDVGLSFNAGQSVVGDRIILNNGAEYRNCVILEAPYSGIAINDESGIIRGAVVNPHSEELAGIPRCN